jgi:hypothetical protein
MVLEGSSVSIYTALASLPALKALYEEGMVELVEAGSTWRHSSFSSAAMTTVVTNSLLLYS